MIHTGIDLVLASRAVVADGVDPRLGLVLAGLAVVAFGVDTRCCLVLASLTRLAYVCVGTDSP